jgi:hypothetical protein
MRTRRSLITALALGALGPPAAFGAPHASTVTPVSGKQASQGGATIVRVDDRGGFDWADAGVGAAGGVALSALGAGLVLLVSEHRKRPST